MAGLSRSWRLGALTTLGLAAGAAAMWAVRDVPAALGARLSGVRPDRVRRSPQYRDGAFHNGQQIRALAPGGTSTLLRDGVLGRQRRRPTGLVPVIDPGYDAPADGLSIVWYGWATALVELGGARVLFDPIWSDRCSPSRLMGPRRLHPPPVPLSRIPAVDAIVISHDHYDHLDLPTVRALVRTQSAPFLVPLGVGAHLERWGVPDERIVELDWDEGVTLGGLSLTATAAQHFSGRAFARNRTLWASWVVASGTHRIFFSGDSGYFGGYAGIGAEHGPFDASLVQIGAYGDAWPDVHMTPEEAVQAHLDLRGGLLVPIHWCTFNLAFHAWREPPDRLWREAKARDVRLAVPRPGERVDVAEPPAVDGWWQAL